MVGLIRHFAGLLIAFTVMNAGTSLAQTSATDASTIVVAARKTPTGIDPNYHFAPEDMQVRHAVYDKLIDLRGEPDSTGLIKPVPNDFVGRLAESWEISADGLTLTFRLRKGVMSHAGNELVADDVQYTWDRFWDLDAVSAFYPKFVLGITEPSWRVVDKYTWELRLLKPNAISLLLMINNDFQVLDSIEVKKHATSEDPWATKWLATNGAGHGAYRLMEWSPGRQVRLQRFEEFYGEKPFFSEVIIREVPESANRSALLQSGAVDIAQSLELRDLKALEGASGVKVWATSGNRLYAFVVRHTNKPWDDVRNRQALEYATPTDAIREAIFLGYAAPLLGPMPPTYPTADPALWPYSFDPEKARQILEETGAVGSELVISFDSGAKREADTATILKTAYEDVGLKVSLNPQPSASYFTQLRAGEFSSFIQLSAPIVPDPGYVLSLRYPCGGNFNQPRYCNEKVDSLLEAGYATNDPGERERIYREVQQILINDATDVWLGEPGWQLATGSDIEGVAWDLPNYEKLTELRRSGG